MHDPCAWCNKKSSPEVLTFMFDSPTALNDAAIRQKMKKKVNKNVL